MVQEKESQVREKESPSPELGVRWAMGGRGWLRGSRVSPQPQVPGDSREEALALPVPVLLSCSSDDALAMHFLKTSVCLEDLTPETLPEDDARDVGKHDFQGGLRTS